MVSIIPKWVVYDIVLTCGDGSIPINTIFKGMNIHLPAILMWTTGVQGFDTLLWFNHIVKWQNTYLSASVWGHTWSTSGASCRWTSFGRMPVMWSRWACEISMPRGEHVAGVRAFWEMPKWEDHGEILRIIGNIYRKPGFLPWNMGVSCNFSLIRIQWKKMEGYDLI